jgi:transposase
LRALVDGVLRETRGTFERMYSSTRRPGIPPEQLLRASLSQALLSIRSERQLTRHNETCLSRR